MEILVLGSGTSHGVPMIGCKCDVCTSTNPKNQRTRPSILVSHRGSHILVDTGPEFRIQSIKHDLNRIDAVIGEADGHLGADRLTITIARADQQGTSGTRRICRLIRGDVHLEKMLVGRDDDFLFVREQLTIPH